MLEKIILGLSLFLLCSISVSKEIKCYPGLDCPEDIPPIKKQKNNTNPHIQPSNHELNYWQETKKCNQPICYKNFLKRYPHGKYAILAQSKLKVSKDVAQKPTLNTPKYPGAVWKYDGHKFDLILESKPLSGSQKTTPLACINNGDCFVFNKATKIYYFLENMRKRKDSILRSAPAIFAPDSAIWRYDGSKFDLIAEGKIISGNPKKLITIWVNNDLLGFYKPKGINYLLKNMKHITDYKMRPAHIIH